MLHHPSPTPFQDYPQLPAARSTSFPVAEWGRGDWIHLALGHGISIRCGSTADAAGWHAWAQAWDLASGALLRERKATFRKGEITVDVIGRGIAESEAVVAVCRDLLPTSDARCRGLHPRITN